MSEFMSSRNSGPNLPLSSVSTYNLLYNLAFVRGLSRLLSEHLLAVVLGVLLPFYRDVNPRAGD